MIRVNGVALPTPSDYFVSIMNISKAERNAAGTIVIDRVATKRKIEISYKHLDKTELSTTLKRVSPVYFAVDYIDPEEGGWKSGSFYCGDKNIGALDYKNGEIRWKDIKFNLIER